MPILSNNNEINPTLHPSHCPTNSIPFIFKVSLNMVSALAQQYIPNHNSPSKQNSWLPSITASQINSSSVIQKVLKMY